MKKRDLKKLALMGLTGGMLVATQSAVHADSEAQSLNEASGAINESELLSQLSEEGQELYNSLDEEGQLLARLVVGPGCGCGQNSSEKLYKGGAHSCGKGSCGGLVSDNFEGGHSCGGGGGHSCGGGGGYSGGHSCGGGNYGGGGHSCGGGYGGGGHSCGSNPNMPPAGQQSYYPVPQGQPGQPGQFQGQPQDTNRNRSMPQFENQPQYQNSQTPKQSASNNYQSNRYVAEEQAFEQTAEPKLTETELKTKLNTETKKVYDSLSPEGKKLALKLANQGCKGKNDCKGQNACKGDNNSCAGQGGCKGTSVGKFTDKNKAVQVAAMKEKRNGASKNY